MDLFLLKILTLGPLIVPWLAYATGTALYFVPRLRPLSAKKMFLALAGTTAVGRLGYAALETVGQFNLWAGNSFTRSLLAFPAAGGAPTALHAIPYLTEHPLGYFLVYSWGRFWLNPLLAIGAAFAFYFFLMVLKKHNARFFDEGETELGFFAALVAGWPGFAIFLPLVFLSMTLISLFRLIVLRETLTTLGLPLVLAAGVTLLWGSALVRFLGLGALWI